MEKKINRLRARVEKLEHLSSKKGKEEREAAKFVAEILARISGQNTAAVLRRISSRDPDFVKEVMKLKRKLQGKSIKEILKEPFFSETFMNFSPTPYQLELLVSKAKQESVLWSRQAGKSTTIGLKGFKFCVTHPASQFTITAPGLRQSKLVIKRTGDQIYKMNPVARRAWIEKSLQQSIRLHNRARMKAFPYDIERLHGETSDIVFIDEVDFTRDTQELIEGTLMPQMATRWDKGAQIFIASTAWKREGFFYKTQYDPKFRKFWKPFFVTWEEPVKCGLITQDFIDRQRAQMSPERFEREYECKFLADAGRWLPHELIASCVDSKILGPWRFEDSFKGLEFYLGIDVGQVADYAVLAIVEKVGEVLILRHVHVFPLGTEYDVITSYAKVISERWQSTVVIKVDATNERALAENMEKYITKTEVQGVALSMQTKMKCAQFLRQKMNKRQFRMYFDPEVISGLVVEQYKEIEGGNIIFSHPQGTHDDIFWAICLAAAASMGPSPGALDAFKFG